MPVMHVRSSSILPILVLVFGSVAEGSDHVSPALDPITINGLSVYSHGTVWYSCDTIISACNLSGYHNITDGTTGSATQNTINVAEIPSGTERTVYDQEINTPTANSHCYQANLSATGSEGATQRVSSATICAPSPPPPPPPP